MHRQMEENRSCEASSRPTQDLKGHRLAVISAQNREKRSNIDSQFFQLKYNGSAFPMYQIQCAFFL